MAATAAVLLLLVLPTVPADAAGVPASVTISPSTIYTPADSYYTPVSATVRDSTGAAVPGVAVSWTASGNATFSSPASVTNSSGVATNSVSAKNGWGKQTITASSGTVSATATLYGYGCASEATLTLGHPYLSASGPLSTPATVLVTDNNSPPDPIPGLQPQLSASGNDTHGPVTDNGNGTYSATVTASGAGTQTITAAVPNQCGATGTASLDVYGPATKVSLALNRTSFPATGMPQPQPNLLSITGNTQQSAEYMPAVYDPELAVPEATATVTDATGNMVPADTVTFAASGGITFEPTVNNGDGTYSVEMVSSTTPGGETITATDMTTGVSSAAVAVTESFGALHTSGTQVLDSNVKQVFFRGINMEPSAPDPYLVNEFPEPSFYDTAQGWGANFVRAFLNSDQWQQSCPTGRPDGSAATSSVNYDSYYQTAFEEYVRAATERGMFVLITLGAAPRFTCDPGGSVAQIMADRDTGKSDDSSTFWKSVANTFKDNPLVGFEPYNEPHIASSDIPTGSTETTDSVWLNGGLVDNGTWTAAGMQEMYDAIRSTGANNLVFVDGPNWADTPPAYLVSSPASATHSTDAPAFNIVYVVHYYSCPNPNTASGATNPYSCSSGITPPDPNGISCPSATNPPSWDNPAGNLQQWVTWRAANNVPVMEDEFGWPSHTHNPVDSCFDQATINFDEANGIPWAVYNMMRYEDAWSLAYFNSTPSYAPTVSGAVVKSALAANFNQSY